MYKKIDNATDYAKQTDVLDQQSQHSLEKPEHTSKKGNTSVFSYFRQYETSEFEQIWDNAPESNEYKVIFPWHKKTKEYSTMEFNPLMVYSIISYIELENVMDSLRSLKFYNIQSLIRNQVFWRNFLFMIPLVTFAIIAFFFYEHITLHLGNNMNVGFLAIPILIFEIVWIALMTKAMRKRFEKLLLRRQQKITEILDRWNENFYEPKGLKLHCGYLGAWLELDVNIMSNNDYVESHFLPQGPNYERLTLSIIEEQEEE